MKILVTGGAGFIGSHLVEHYQGRAQIMVLDNLRTGNRNNLAGFEHTFMEGSVTDRKAVRRAMAGADYIFHLAAMISVPESMEKPRECVEINVQGLLHVLEEAVVAGARKVVLASSSAIYGDNPLMPLAEHELPRPKSPYAVTKLDGEYYLEMFRKENGLDTVSLRFFNVFGPRQDPRSPYAAAVPIFIERALSGEPLNIYGDGQQTRDFVYVKDVVSAMSHVAERTEPHGTYNVGYGGCLALNDLAGMILRHAKSDSPIQYLPERAGDVKHSRADIGKLMATGFKHTCSLESGLSQTLDYFRRERMHP